MNGDEEHRNAAPESDDDPSLLSSDEIDHLLDSVQAQDQDLSALADDGGAEVLEEAAPAGPVRTKIHDFARPNRLQGPSRERFAAALEQYGDRLSRSLGALVNDYVAVELSSVDMLLYQELLRTVPEPCFYAELRAEDAATSLVEAAPSLAIKLVSSVLGVVVADPRDPTVLGPVEEHMALRLIAGSVWRSYVSSWFDSTNRVFRLQRIHRSGGAMAMVFDPFEPVGLGSFAVDVGDVQSMVVVCVPCRDLAGEDTNRPWSTPHWGPAGAPQEAPMVSFRLYNRTLRNLLSWLESGKGAVHPLTPGVPVYPVPRLPESGSEESGAGE
jgi:flagellar motor switch protein FliM